MTRIQQVDSAADSDEAALGARRDNQKTNPNDEDAAPKPVVAEPNQTRKDAAAVDAPVVGSEAMSPPRKAVDAAAPRDVASRRRKVSAEVAERVVQALAAEAPPDYSIDSTRMATDSLVERNSSS